MPSGASCRTTFCVAIVLLRGNRELVCLDAPCDKLRRFLQHVLPHRLQKIRHYGFLSRRSTFTPAMKACSPTVVASGNLEHDTDTELSVSF